MYMTEVSILFLLSIVLCTVRKTTANTCDQAVQTKKEIKIGLKQLKAKQSFKEIEELEKKLEKLEAHMDQKNWYFSAMIHEIRQPLLSLMYNTTQAEKKIQNLEQKNQQIIKDISDSGEILFTMVGNILDVEKSNYETMSQNDEVIDLRETINKVISTLTSRAQLKGLSLECTVSEDTPQRLLIDKARLLQVLMNLIGNAIKFTRKGYVRIKVLWQRDEESIPQDAIERSPDVFFTSNDNSLAIQSVDKSVNSENNDKWITLSAQKRKNKKQGRKGANSSLEQKRTNKSFQDWQLQSIQSIGQIEEVSNLSRGTDSPVCVYSHETRGILLIKISDTGKGINPENIQKLFHPFQQENKLISKQYGGTGLGLWNAKKILRIMQSEISVDSYPGLGTTFRISIPVSVPKQFSPFALQLKEHANKLELEVLIIDPDEQRADNSAKILRQKIKFVNTYSSSHDLLKVYQQLQNVQMIVWVDDIREEMSGVEAAKAVREIQKLKQSETQAPKFLYFVLLVDDMIQISTQSYLYMNLVDKFILKEHDPDNMYSLIKEMRLAKEKYDREWLSTKKTLIVDDETFVLIPLNEMFSELGFTVIEACNGEEALSILNSEQVDLLVIDNEMPGMKGTEVISYLRRNEMNKQLPRLPIILCSGNDALEDADVEYYCVKPLNSDYLQQVLQELGIL